MDYPDELAPKLNPREEFSGFDFVEEEFPNTKPREGRCNHFKDDDTYCHAFPMDNGLCRHHGGEHTPDPDKDVFGTLMSRRTRSRFLPKHLRDRYDELMKDDKVLEMREDIVLIDTRVTELLDALKNQSGAAKLWKRLKVKKNSYLRCMASNHKSRAADYLDDILEIIDTGATDFEAWQSITELIESRRKVVESERKRMIEQQQTMSTQQAMMFMHQMLKIIQEHVKDPVALRGIAIELNGLIDTPSRAEA